MVTLLIATACTNSPPQDVTTAEDSGEQIGDSSSSGSGSGESSAAGVSLQMQVDATAQPGVDGGVIALLVRDGVATQAAAGTRNLGGDALQGDSLFSVGSVSKVYTATIIYQLAEEGAVDLDAPLSTYLPDSAYGATVTLELLLGHRGGVPDYASNPEYLQNALLDPERVFTTGELIDFAAFEEPGPVDEAFSYSNTGYLLLGQVIEAVTGDTLDAALQARIIEPLGLVSTGYVAPPDFPDGLPSAWLDPTDFGFPADTELPVMPVSAAFSGCQSDCGIITTAPELRTFFEGVFDGTLLSSESLALMTRSDEDAAELDGWGRGLQLYAPAGTADPEYGHGGSGTGYTTVVTFKPLTGDLTIVFASNDAFELDSMLEQYAPSVLESW